VNKENVMKWILAGLAVAAGSLAGPVAANAEFALTDFGGSITQNGVFSRQAGAHSDLTTRIVFPSRENGTILDENVRTVDVDLPPGVIGDPTDVPTCSYADLIAGGGEIGNCAAETQVGIMLLHISAGDAPPSEIPVYNVERPADKPALFAFNYFGVPVPITPVVRPGDFGISAHVGPISQALPLFSSELILWGVPADPSHDAHRHFPGGFGITGAHSTAPRRPFMTNGGSCTTTPAVTAARVSSWQHADVFTSASFSSDLDGIPFVNERCDRQAFDPAITVKPVSHMADAPTGLDVDLTVPQNNAPDGLATANVRKVAITFPEGMAVSPSSAAGLGACAPDQIGLGTDTPNTCPESSKIGSVEIHTPVLDVPLKGDVILATQEANPFGSLLAMYIVAKGPGVMLKLPGRVDTDTETGQLTATFDNNPQLPFETLHLELRSGARAPLATPTACGTYTTHAEITSWASDTPVSIDTPMAIDEGCGDRPFEMSMGAGVESPVAGGSSPFSFALTRADRTQYLSQIDATLPPGLLARVADATLCPAAQADAGTCARGTEIGSTSVLSGPGESPLALKGRVYFTGPYKGAPYGLSIVVPTAGQAGPYDLGDVVVRAAIHVDPTDAHVTVKSDPLPRIVEGFPLRLRQVIVSIDRPNFMLNPTSCDAKTVRSQVTSFAGQIADLSVPFRVVGCGDLGFDPQLTLTLSGKGQRTTGDHPRFAARLTESAGDANPRRVAVSLPKSLALDPGNAEALCEFTDGNSADPKCPAGSIVGRAHAETPILKQPLDGPVYFVKNVRTDAKTGAQIRTLPMLVVPLSGPDGVKITLKGVSSVNDDRLVATFDDLPDAIVSKFSLTIDGGKNGILAVSNADICKRSQIADEQLDGHNGDGVDGAILVATRSCPFQILASQLVGKSLIVKVAGLGKGRLTISGGSIKRTSRKVRGATVSTVKAPLTAETRASLRRHPRMRIRLRASFKPAGGKARTITANKPLRLNLKRKR
jgi:hypothetical protein